MTFNSPPLCDVHHPELIFWFEQLLQWHPEHRPKALPSNSPPRRCGGQLRHVHVLLRISLADRKEWIQKFWWPWDVCRSATKQRSRKMRTRIPIRTELLVILLFGSVTNELERYSLPTVMYLQAARCLALRSLSNLIKEDVALYSQVLSSWPSVDSDRSSEYCVPEPRLVPDWLSSSSSSETSVSTLPGENKRWNNDIFTVSSSSSSDASVVDLLSSSVSSVAFLASLAFLLDFLPNMVNVSRMDGMLWRRRRREGKEEILNCGCNQERVGVGLWTSESFSFFPTKTRHWRWNVWNHCLRHSRTNFRALEKPVVRRAINYSWMLFCECCRATIFAQWILW